MTLQELKLKCEEKGIIVDDHMLEQFDQYAKLLIEWNQKMNLTAIDEYEAIMEKHFYDSLLPLCHLDINGKLADVGSGAGFPSVPMKIVRPDLKVTIIEPLNKRCNFLKEVIKVLNLKDIEVLNIRAEDAKELRESFDVVTARAVANLSMLSELCIPLVKKDGIFLAMKGLDAYNEENKATNALKILGVKRENAYEETLSDGSMRVDLIYRKTEKTPAKYPRNFGKIKKNPL